ncbi:hypothetical protein FALBO_8314 [Fusarium albosuccineum]|uniref:Uncharacterized protein n=1 Tax=Fusarium albosuccineum TaxID=1237068 RepID=A0A8H4PA17_9HYPO|nr:hypothetical protein FALBO_8314 [Fusarium albosuccineum]
MTTTTPFSTMIRQWLRLTKHSGKGIIATKRALEFRFQDWQAVLKRTWTHEYCVENNITDYALGHDLIVETMEEVIETGTRRIIWDTATDDSLEAFDLGTYDMRTAMELPGCPAIISPKPSDRRQELPAQRERFNSTLKMTPKKNAKLSKIEYSPVGSLERFLRNNYVETRLIWGPDEAIIAPNRESHLAGLDIDVDIGEMAKTQPCWRISSSLDESSLFSKTKDSALNAAKAQRLMGGYPTNRTLTCYKQALLAKRLAMFISWMRSNLAACGTNADLRVSSRMPCLQRRPAPPMLPSEVSTVAVNVAHITIRIKDMKDQMEEQDMLCKQRSEDDETQFKRETTEIIEAVEQLRVHNARPSAKYSTADNLSDGIYDDLVQQLVAHKGFQTWIQS